ncbi:MAG: hypothetical protein OXN97_02810, partial [Bryobacterales bacterium]|nr:hypothetical protein [Bryobacterales bacterium]
AWNAGFSRHAGRRPAEGVSLLRRVTPTAWSADLRSASRGSAKPALMAPRPTDVGNGSFGR